MSYGENLGTTMLAEQLMILAEQIYCNINNGVPYERIRKNAKWLMQGAMELWERIADYDSDVVCGVDEVDKKETIPKNSNKSIEDIFNTLNDEQKNAVYFLIGQAMKVK